MRTNVALNQWTSVWESGIWKVKRNKVGTAVDSQSDWPSALRWVGLLRPLTSLTVPNPGPLRLPKFHYCPRIEFQWKIWEPYLHAALLKCAQIQTFISWKAAPCSHEGRNSLGIKATELRDGNRLLATSFEARFPSGPQPAPSSGPFCYKSYPVPLPAYTIMGWIFLSLTTERILSERNRECLSWALSWEMWWHICGLVRTLNRLEMCVLGVSPGWDRECWHGWHILEEINKSKPVWH